MDARMLADATNDALDRRKSDHAGSHRILAHLMGSSVRAVRQFAVGTLATLPLCGAVHPLPGQVQPLEADITDSGEDNG